MEALETGTQSRPSALQAGNNPRRALSIADIQKRARPVLVSLPAIGLLLGSGAGWLGRSEWSSWIWAAGALPVLLVLFIEIVVSLRRGDVGLDIVAALSMTGALILGETLAAIIVALMYAGGQYLESFAERRAGREITALLSRVPRTAVVYRQGRLEEVPLDVIGPGDQLMIRQGDVVPVDGAVAEGTAVLDQSALTGESLPVQKRVGEPVLSGSTNAGDSFQLSATHRAANSTYAGIIRLVEAAQRSKAPMSRLADRFAMVFLGITILLAGGAWLWSDDPIRALAVLVVATPCPLILAVPVAIVSGVSRAAKLGVLVKGGKALEVLGRVRTLVIDKTGTLTYGRARLVATHLFADMPADMILQTAASLEQASKHVIAQALVAEAQTKGLRLLVPTDVVEVPGEGVEGTIEGRRVVVGGLRFVAARTTGSSPRLSGEDSPTGSVSAAVAVDGELVGVLVLADELRPGTDNLLRDLKCLGVSRIILATGDRKEVADAIVKGLPVDLVHTELTPEQKIAVVTGERGHGPVMMIGDGVNDAPALAAADLGVAMGARGAAASAEAADVVLLVDRLDRIAPAIRIARRARGIALQSVYIGIGFSTLGMMAAALGYLTPVQGALAQEAIDVAAIVNALRVLRGPEGA